MFPESKRAILAGSSFIMLAFMCITHYNKVIYSIMKVGIVVVALTKKQKEEIIEIIGRVDPKKLDIDLEDESKVKWFRFGSHNGLQIAVEIIKAINEKIS